MELIPWKPFRELGSLRKEMDSLWDRFFGGALSTGLLREAWVPSVDISETKEGFVVKAELPGLDARDVNVNISGDILTIKGEKKTEREQKDEHLHCVERYSGTFQRSFQLPSSVKADKIEARFDKGVLEITLPKAKEAKAKEIEIKVA